MRKIKTLRQRVTKCNSKKTLLSLFFALIGVFMLSTTCEKENEEPDPDIELEDAAHRIDPDAENVYVEWFGETISCQEIDGKLVFQGDIIVIPDQDNTKGAVHAGARLWDEGKVFYQLYGHSDWEDIEAAMEHISSYTYIKFVELKTPEAVKYRNRSYIKFIWDLGRSWSYLGMLSPEVLESKNLNAQELSIGGPGIGTVIHELGHALGLIHEHSRPDRDIDIMIDTANIDEKFFKNGKLDPWVVRNVLAKDPMGEHSTSLDYGSIMMYSPSAGIAKPGKEVLKKDNGKSYKDEYQREHLSPPDIDVINALYPQKRVSPDIIISEENSKFIDDSLFFRAAGEVIFEGYFPVISEKGFYYGKINSDLTKVVVPGTERGSYHFDLEVEDLEPDAKYTVKAYVVQDNEEFLSGKAVTFHTPADTTNTFTDPRDGNVYKYVTIGSQTWMAENLKYLPCVVGRGTGSNATPYYYVYDYFGTDVNAAKATSNYANYGVLYNWPAALNACPTGWHLPSDAEWEQLINYLVLQGYPNAYNDPNGAGNALKSCRQVNSPLGGHCATSEHPRWESHNTTYGFDEFGFSALPGGYRIDGTYNYIGSCGYWWSASESSTNYALVRYMYYYYCSVSSVGYNKEDGFSVRCVRD